MAEWLSLTIFWLTLILMLVGLLGLIIPVYPGVVIIWLAALGYGIVSGFGGLGTWIFVFLTLLMIAGTTVDNLLMGINARQEGAAWSSLIVGLVAGVVGTLIFPPVGGIIAAPLVILLLEYRRQRDWRKAFSALRGLAIGWGTAFVARFGIGVLMIILWLIWDLKG